MADTKDVHRPDVDRTSGRASETARQTVHADLARTEYPDRHVGRGNAIWFILGLLVLAVLVIGYTMYGSEPVGDDDVSVDIEATPPAAESEPPAGSEPPAAEPEAPPAEPEAPPVDADQPPAETEEAPAQ